jgi:hypothetical protein
MGKTTKITKTIAQPIPTARQNGLVVKELADEILVYDTTSDKAHCLNRTAALVWGFCDGQTTVDGIVAKLGTESKASVNVNTVSMAIAQLDEINLLTAKIDLNSNVLSRRQLMRAIGIGALVAVPIITSIVAPRAAQASTCVASGGSCISSAECCSGLCSGVTCA